MATSQESDDMKPPENFEPLLASPLKDGQMPNFPCLASPKLDGIRALQFSSVVFSRKLKPIPNRHIQEVFGVWELCENLDGEFIVGPPTADDAYRKTMSGLMSRDGEPGATFWVFDIFQDGPFKERFVEATRRVSILRRQGVPVQMVPHRLINSAEELTTYEEECLAEGYEGLMVRDPNGRYKCGRSTVKEGILLKVKRFLDSEAEILECLELEHNQNVATQNELGRTKRSSHKAGRVAGGKLGAMRVKDVKTGVEFQVGSGFEDSEKEALWVIREKLVGSFIKYRYFPTGNKEKPRFPVYLGMRDPMDM